MSGKGRGEEGIWEEGMQRAGAPSSFLLFIERRKRRPDDASKERLKRPRSGRHTVCLSVVFSFSFVSFFLSSFFSFLFFSFFFFFSLKGGSLVLVAYVSLPRSIVPRRVANGPPNFRSSVCIYIYIYIYICMYV